MPWDYGVCHRCSHRTRIWGKDEDFDDTWLCQTCLDDDDRAWFKEQAQREKDSEWPPDRE